MTEPARDPFRLSYTDNNEVTVGARLSAELAHDPTRLWVASGYFGASMWGAIGEALATVGEFRLLLGKDYQLANLDAGRQEERRIADLVSQALRDETQPPKLVSRDAAEHVAALIAFLERQKERGQPVVKLWQGEGFLHAKAYILAGSVGIGSANLTFPGLVENRELVGWRQDRSVVAEVAGWFDRYWNDDSAVDYTDELLATLRATPLVSESYTPYDVLIRTLAERYGVDQPPSLEQVSFSLKWFQEDAVFRLVRLLNGPARGALLADAVGLGKTYMALGVIHHFLYTEVERRRGRGKPVLLVIPASLVGMWTTALRDAGLEWACEIVSMQSLRDDFDPQPFAGAELVVIDEAHRLRGGRQWFRSAVDLVTAGGRTDRRVLLLTATPVNTGMEDLIHELRVLTKNQRHVWAPEIADFEQHLRRVERDRVDPFPVLDRSIVRRSRSDILRAQQEARDAGVDVDEVALPDRRPLHIRYDYGDGGDLFGSFAQTLRSLELAPYDLERYRLEEPATEGPVQLNLDGQEFDAQDNVLAVRPGTLAALCAAGLLVRFQSSLAAIEISLRRLDAVLHRFGDAIDADPPRLLDLGGNPTVRALLVEEAHEDTDAEGNTEADLGTRWERVLAAAATLDSPESYDLEAIRSAIVRDRRRIAALRLILPPRERDGKIAALAAALNRDGPEAPGEPALAGRRVIVFTQFRDTAVYLEQALGSRWRVARIDGSVDPDRRAQITAWYDPQHAAEREAVAAGRGELGPDLLVSTDVLAEGHNLQLADCVVNFDLHFNPQVVVQRCGRIDRIGSPHRLVHLVSCLPPEPLDRHIGLLGRLDERFRRIHGLGLGDERVTTIAGDRPGRTLEQMRRLYLRDDVAVLDEVERSWTLGSTDYMRQPLEAFFQRAGREEIERIPVGVSSVKRLPRDWRHGPGTFIALGGPKNREGQRQSHWRFYPRPGVATGLWGVVLTDEVEMFRAIICREGEPRLQDPAPTPGPTVIDWDLLRHAATTLAAELTAERSMAQLTAGASDRSRRVRTELRARLAGLDLEDADALLERLLQVRVEDYDGRSGWSRFVEARRRLSRPASRGERRDAGRAVIAAGIELFGRPEDAGPVELAPAGVSPEELQLIAYEVLVEA